MDPSMSDTFKTTLRNTLKQIRSRLPINYQTTSSKLICNRIKKLESFRQAKRIGLYHAVNGEVHLDTLWQSCPLQGKFCYFPALNKDKTLTFLPATPSTPFKKNQYGILEPDVATNLSLPLSQLDVLLIPLVAFDKECSRLGMGMGYYDRTLANHPSCLLVGVAYEFQKIDFIESEAWDVPLDLVITQKNTYQRMP